MLVEYEDVVLYLLNRKWLSNETVVDGDLSVVNASRRNGNFNVRNGAGPHYFLKQETRERAGKDRVVGSVAYEAAVYELLATVYGDRPVFSSFPRYYDFDGDERLLIIEALVECVNLKDYYRRRGRFSAAIGRSLGVALADIHAVSERKQAEIRERFHVSEPPPWVFFLPEPDRWIYLNSSHASLALIRIVQQQEELCRSFEDLRAQWRNTAFIHGDLKWDNCLLSAYAASRRKPPLKIVDWETARWGDPCWDVATVFSEYLNLWLSSIPISEEHPPDHFLKFARFPLDRMQSSVRAFWGAYRGRMKIPADEETGWLLRAVNFAGVRLVQTAFEQSQVDAGITTGAISLLQLCSNIVARPLETAVQLLGIPLPGLQHGDMEPH